MAATVWLVSFVVRLLPEPLRERVVVRKWSNNSMELGVKLVSKKPELAEF